MKFKVGILEELYRTVEIEAQDREEALKKAEEMYHSEEIVLASENYCSTDFEILEMDKENVENDLDDLEEPEL